MKSFGRYLSKYFISFSALIAGLLLLNLTAFVWTFYSVVSKDYGHLSPQKMTEAVSSASHPGGITDEMAKALSAEGIWAMFLDGDGRCLWSVDLPSEIPKDYSLQDVAVFAKGYLKDYPVFVRSREDGLLVLGYPKGSYEKITGNYYPASVIRILPVFFSLTLVFDLAALFLTYCFSRKKIIRLTEPIISSIISLSEGKPVSLSISGDLSEIADSVNQASRILSRQNQARANWISGVSHDIRTPLSMIMGYSGKIACDTAADDNVRRQAEIIKQQSMKIKELVQDLNLVTQLEYDMQPLRREPVRLSKLLRTCAAEFQDSDPSGSYPLEISISSYAETALLNCDPRLILRALSNLMQNSVRHNPDGCGITLTLDAADSSLLLTVADDGAGLSAEKLRELLEKPHYMESTDERLDLRHGLGLILVRQIMNAHGGSMGIESGPSQGYRTILAFPEWKDQRSLI